MDIREIQSMAHHFREATERAYEAGAFGNEYPFNKFPHGCCDDMSDLFGEMLLRFNVPVFEVFGEYDYDNWEHRYSHVWLEVGSGIVIDLTGDQYKNDPIMMNYDIPCYIGKPNSLHKLFETERKPFYGIEDYPNDAVKSRLWKLYKIIGDFLIQREVDENAILPKLRN